MIKLEKINILKQLILNKLSITNNEDINYIIVLKEIFASIITNINANDDVEIIFDNINKIIKINNYNIYFMFIEENILNICKNISNDMVMHKVLLYSNYNNIDKLAYNIKLLCEKSMVKSFQYISDLYINKYDIDKYKQLLSDLNIVYNVNHKTETNVNIEIRHYLNFISINNINILKDNNNKEIVPCKLQQFIDYLYKEPVNNYKNNNNNIIKALYNNNDNLNFSTIKKHTTNNYYWTLLPNYNINKLYLSLESEAFEDKGGIAAIYEKIK